MNRYHVTPGDIGSDERRESHRCGAQEPMLAWVAEVVLRIGNWLLPNSVALMFFILYVMDLDSGVAGAEPDYRRGLSGLIPVVVALLLSLVPLLSDGAPRGLKVQSVLWGISGIVMALDFAIELW